MLLYRPPIVSGAVTREPNNSDLPNQNVGFHSQNGELFILGEKIQTD